MGLNPLFVDAVRMHASTRHEDTLPGSAGHRGASTRLLLLTAVLGAILALVWTLA